MTFISMKLISAYGTWLLLTCCFCHTCSHTPWICSAAPLITLHSARFICAQAELIKKITSLTLVSGNNSQFIAQSLKNSAPSFTNSKNFSTLQYILLISFLEDISVAFIMFFARQIAHNCALHMLPKWSPEVNVPRTTSCMLIKGLPATSTTATIKLIGLRTFPTDVANLIAMQAQKNSNCHPGCNPLSFPFPLPLLLQLSLSGSKLIIIIKNRVSCALARFVGSQLNCTRHCKWQIALCRRHKFAVTMISTRQSRASVVNEGRRRGSVMKREG